MEVAPKMMSAGLSLALSNEDEDISCISCTGAGETLRPGSAAWGDFLHSCTGETLRPGWRLGPGVLLSPPAGTAEEENEDEEFLSVLNF
jgi:hypothetical protein